MRFTFATEMQHQCISARLTNQQNENMKEYQLHKISGVDKNICTAEQKLAYEYALNNYKLNISPAGLALLVLKWRAIDKRYNWQAVAHLIDTHLESFRGRDTHILSSYEEVGKAFPVKIDNN